MSLEDISLEEKFSFILCEKAELVLKMWIIYIGMQKNLKKTYIVSIKSSLREEILQTRATQDVDYFRLESKKKEE